MTNRQWRIQTFFRGPLHCGGSGHSACAEFNMFLSISRRPIFFVEGGKSIAKLDGWTTTGFAPLGFTIANWYLLHSAHRLQSAVTYTVPTYSLGDDSSGSLSTGICMYIEEVLRMSVSLSVCVETTCESVLTQVTNAMVLKSDGNSYGAFVTYICRYGNQFLDVTDTNVPEPRTVRCNEDGNWGPNFADCLRKLSCVCLSAYLLAFLYVSLCFF